MSFKNPNAQEMPKRKKLKGQAKILAYFKPEAKGAFDPVIEPPIELSKELPGEASVKIEQMVRNHEEEHMKQQQVVLSPEALQEGVVAKVMRKRKGGRPINSLDKRGVAGGSSSNRKLTTQRFRKYEFAISAKRLICKELDEMRGGFGTEKLFWAAAKLRFRLSCKRLRKIYAKRKQIEVESEAMTEQRRSLTHYPWVLGKTKHKATRHKKEAVQRKRLSGGGKKPDFPELIEEIKVWVNSQRAYGQTVLKRHLSWRWMTLLETYIARQKNLKDEELSAADRTKMRKAEESLKKLMGNERTCLDRANQIMKWLELRNLVPHLMTDLTPIEEQIGAQLSWQNFDYMQHRIAFGSEKEIGEHVVRPADVLKSRRQTVIIAADQVPIWVKSTTEKELFLKSEYSPKAIKEVRAAIEMATASAEQKQSAVVIVSRPSVDAAMDSGQRQLRVNKRSQAFEFFQI